MRAAGAGPLVLAAGDVGAAPARPHPAVASEQGRQLGRQDSAAHVDPPKSNPPPPSASLMPSTNLFRSWSLITRISNGQSVTSPAVSRP